MKKLFTEFKEFIVTGNVIDLAVGVVIGSAFTAIVTRVVEGLITPLIALVISLFTNSTSMDDSIGALVWSPRKGVVFDFGSVITAIITFLITGFVLFAVVKGINKLQSFNKAPEEEEEEEVTAEDYLAEIRDLLRLQSGLPVDVEIVDEDKKEDNV
ncbi:large conductance mechanosensitive channel protein [Enterococcus sp. DIV2402]|uniref:Large-conductance mechanosensitive channel n=1 Tax=Candidatus Enterococcus lowellii TaxID=2230877 RepID=A0ABZ2SK31_9ENTE|nr:large conductance mechanosensitive channel protein MscL [Enterococcus sp. DIV2402]MBO0465186.1 large conductance mechanosensitive channel protein MscL [Enterococcus sp. DIV2402]